MLLLREGRHVNVKRVYRLYRELGLQLRYKPPKRRVKAKLREGRIDATRPNDTWAMDFVHDQLATGKKLRVAATENYREERGAVESYPRHLRRLALSRLNRIWHTRRLWRFNAYEV